LKEGRIFSPMGSRALIIGAQRFPGRVEFYPVRHLEVTSASRTVEGDWLEDCVGLGKVRFEGKEKMFNQPGERNGSTSINLRYQKLVQRKEQGPSIIREWTSQEN